MLGIPLEEPLFLFERPERLFLKISILGGEYPPYIGFNRN